MVVSTFLVDFRPYSRGT